MTTNITAEQVQKVIDGIRKCLVNLSSEYTVAVGILKSEEYWSFFQDNHPTARAERTLSPEEIGPLSIVMTSVIATVNVFRDTPTTYLAGVGIEFEAYTTGWNATQFLRVFLDNEFNVFSMWHKGKAIV